MVDDPNDPRNRAARISAAYDRAANGQTPEKAPPAAARGSDMVRNSQPGMHLRPSGPDRNAVDRQNHNQELKKEGDREAALQAKAREMADAIRARQKDRERDKDRDR